MDTCHECCNTITTLIEEANDERDLLESKFYHSLKFNKVLTELLKKLETNKICRKKFKNNIIHNIGRNIHRFHEGIDFPIPNLLLLDILARYSSE